MKRILISLAFTVVAISACAQQDFFHRPSPWAGQTLLTLSLFREVRAELKSTPELNSKEDGLLVELQTEFQRALQSANGDLASVRPAVSKLNAKYDEECVKLLSDDQVLRLKQLFVQFNGGNALTNPLVAKDLSITDEENAKFKLAEEEYSKRTRELYQQGESPSDIKAEIAKLQEDLRMSLENVLTSPQKLKFKSMQGVKFEFEKPGAVGPNESAPDGTYFVLRTAAQAEAL